MKKRIKVLKILIAMIILTLVVSCNKGISTSKSEDNLKGKVTILTDKRYENQLKYAVEKFQEIHPKVQVSLNVKDNLYNKVKEDMSNKKPSADIVTIDDYYAQYLISNLSGNFLDVTEEANIYKDKIRKDKFDNLTFKSKVYGIPWSSSPKVILYRSDLFEKSGINVDDIKTWQDYIYAGKKISENTGKKLITNTKSEGSNIYLILSNQLGISYFNKEGNINFNSDRWPLVLQTIKSLYSEGIIYELSSKETLLDAVKKDKVVSFIGDSSDINSLIGNLPEGKGKWKAMKLPAFEPGGNRDVSIGGANLMINSNSSNTKVAKEFIRFALTNERLQIDIMNRYGYFPVNSDVYNLVEFDENNSYLNSKLGFLLANVEKGSQGINYTTNFLSIDKVVEMSLSIENLKSKDSKEILDTLQKNCENNIIKSK